MWTAEQRMRHKVSNPRERRGYPTDISDKEWKLVEPLLPGAAHTGRLEKLHFARSLMRCVTWSGRVVNGACYPTIFLLTKRCTTGLDV
jgi:hypothetical protein